MRRLYQRHALARLAVVVAALALPLAASAGEGDYEPGDDHDDGAPFFGEAKDLKTLGPLEGVRVKAVVKGSPASIVVATDEDGRFRMNGLGKGIGADTVEISCAKDGYQALDAIIRVTSGAVNAPVEVECLMQRK